MTRRISVSNIMRRLSPSGYGVFLRGRYESWADALAQCHGYEDVSLVERVVQRNLAAAAATDGTLGDREMQILAALMVAVNRLARTAIEVLDVGGELGGYCRSLSRFLSPAHAMKWTVLETKLMAAKGNEVFKTDQLSFTDDNGVIAASAPPPDIILASGVLQCLEDPKSLFQAFSRSKARYILVSIFPVIPASTDLLTTRFMKTESYEESYPLWLFSEASWKEVFLKDHTILMQWNVEKSDRLQALDVGYRGFLLERKGLAA